MAYDYISLLTIKGGPICTLHISTVVSKNQLKIISGVCAFHVSKVYDGVIKWKHFLRWWPFVWGIHRLSANSPHKGQWREALMFSFVCARINVVNSREAGYLRRYRAHCDVIVMGSVTRRTTSRISLFHIFTLYKIIVQIRWFMHYFSERISYHISIEIDAYLISQSNNKPFHRH